MSRPRGSKNKMQPYGGFGPGLEPVVQEALVSAALQDEYGIDKVPPCVSRNGIVRAQHAPDRDGRCCFCNFLATPAMLFGEAARPFLGGAQ